MENIQSLTNTNTNEKLATKVTSDGNYNTSIHTYIPTTGWIHAGQMDADGYIDNASKLVNVDKLLSHRELIAAGRKGETDNSMFSQAYMTYLDEAKKQKDLVDANPGINPAQLLGASAPTGSNLVDTAYENVRRVNYLTEVVGRQYNLNDYNANQVVKVRRVNALNVVGFTKTSALMQGIPEIGDHQTPPPFRQTFGTYEKSLYADTFRFEFGMREKKDSVINLQSELTKEIPGIMARMKDDKITDAINALTVTSTLATDWDAITNGNFVYTDDAAADVEADEVNLDQFGGEKVMITTRAIARAYHRNVHQVGIGGAENATSMNDQSSRTGRLALNPSVKFVINNSITADTYTIVAKDSWAELLQGPVSSVSYKNQMSPAQTEGRIIFDFNGFVEKLNGAMQKHDGVTS
jgi:hypothetical protein